MAQRTRGTGFNNTIIAEKILDMLGNKELKLGFRDRSALRKSLESIIGLKGNIGKINAVMNGINRGIINAGSQVASVITVLNGSEKAQKAAELAANERVQKAANAANERIQTLALEKGVWNQGLGLTPSSNPTGTNSSQEGESGGKTVGSFIGG